MQRSGVKTLIYCIIIALILYVLYHFHISSYPLSHSHFATLNSYNILRSYRYYESFWFYLFKITYKSPNKPYKGMYDSQKLCVLWGKKNPLEPLDRPPYKIQRIARGINYEYYCISAYLPSCE